MEKLNINFGKRMKQLRKIHGLTQKKLAKKSRLEPAYIGAVERGERNLTINNIEKIARGFNTEVYKLFLFSDLDPKASQKLPDIKLEKILELIKKQKPEKRSMIYQILTILDLVD